MTVALACLAVAAGCTAAPAAEPAPGTPPAAVFGPPAGTGASPVPPAGLGPVVADLRPAASPAQVGAPLAGRPVPTSQWWTSALTGPWTQSMWAFPVVAQAGPRGLGLGAPTTVTATADAVTAPPAPAWWLGGPLTGVAVVGYGEFSVTLELRREGAAPVVALLAQGSPVVHLWVPAGPLRIDAGTRAQGGGRTFEEGTATDTDAVEVVAADRTWDVRTTAATRWLRTGSELTTELAAPTVLAVAPRPDGAGARWAGAFAAAAADPVTSTSAPMTVDARAGVVEQRLVWSRDGDGDGGLVALLPHQVAALPAPPDVLGRYETARGPLVVVEASEVVLRFPMRGLLVGPPPAGGPTAPSVPLAADLAADLAATRLEGGSYGHPKALGRLALLAETAAATASPDLGAALDLLEAGVDDWFTHTGPGDARWLAYDDVWRGIVGHPSEFGSNDYNDHHFHYGYLVRAAATLQRLGRPAGPARLAGIDLLVEDVMGSTGHLPPFRVWNAYQGHSAASGFAAFADGNNQESSSEAVQAWEAIAAWGWATGRPEVAGPALARYAVEAAAANTYWLGQGLVRPPGYAHTTAGIVWGGKIDFATFFDGRAEAVIGIQLLPFTFGSLYRAGPAATARADEATAAGGGLPRLWPDLFVMERALGDPSAAGAGLGEVEAGNSRTWLQVWTGTLRTLGRVRDDVHADPPMGLAFERDGTTTLAAVNGTPDPQVVVFRTADGAVVGQVAVEPFTSAAVPG
ncbi:glycosyl hydrolase [Pseudonocardia broussonetiae]|uniref:glucan endo-1,3-beta-D-glucosidase n=1 Tax=Pseudonocardia broussonetiae TaxID=2736640 RepID=A0A6M6JQK5_9PSEU|nr:glycosyl hydrolase [Pseudonocardia broussonetiae]QJY49513.1 endo-1,3(4)-beta-glucanase [Pseudonocardia broussonetiae]